MNATETQRRQQELPSDEGATDAVAIRRIKPERGPIFDRLRRIAAAAATIAIIARAILKIVDIIDAIFKG